MKNKKKYLYLIIGLFLLIGCFGCGKKEEVNNNIVGGYTISNSVAGTLPENALNAFNKANTDNKYVPLACMGTQVVAGTNYMILAKDNEKLVILIIYEDLNQNAEITNTYDFNLSEYMTGNKDVSEVEGLAGGWTVSREGNLDTMPQELASAWSESFTNYTDITLQALACLGTQVVSGTNYAMLARSIVEEDETPSLYIAVIYDDLNHNASITSVSYIDLLEIVK